MFRKPSLGAAVGFATVAGLGLAHGGYFARSWGIGVALLSAVVASRGSIERPRWERANAPTLSAHWGSLRSRRCLSMWTSSVTLAMLEVERVALYATFVVALVLAAGSAEQLLHGLVGATVLLSAWALLEHLVVDRDVDAFQGALLTGSVDYANALAALSPIGALAAASLGADRRGWVAIRGRGTTPVLYRRADEQPWRCRCVDGWHRRRRPVVPYRASGSRIVFAWLTLSAVGGGTVAAWTDVTRGQVPSSEVVWEARAVLLLVLAIAAVAGLFARVLPEQPRPISRPVLLGE